MSLTFEPFEVSVDPAQVEDLRRRLAVTRWPDQIPGTTWEYGADRDTVRWFCDRWAGEYDWPAFEARCNRFEQVRVEVDGIRVHLIHARAADPSALPLLLLHGWPGSVAEFFDVIGPLSAGGGPAGGGPGFSVVAPSLPGYGFSGPTTVRGVDVVRIAACLNQVMEELGYDRYVVQGGDWGAMIGTQLAASRPDRVMALHLNMILGGPPDRKDPLAGLDEAERADVAAGAEFRTAETGYQAIQSTKPQTLAYALMDSPAGMAAWILEKFHTWSDCGGDLLSVYDPDRLLDNLSIYWLTGTIGSSMRLYREAGAGGGMPKGFKVTVPTGHARYPGEILRTPRSWAETRYPIHRWTAMPRGGHFAAMEQPERFVDEVRSFFGEFR